MLVGSSVAPLKLSVLDVMPVRMDQSTADALSSSVGLVARADALGYTRYWVAEHHNMASVGATSPPVMLALLGHRTHQIRLGSGGVMLPNHAPLAVAEQFALLEAAFPGRIDLGIGRAPGSDPITSMALRGPAGRGDEDIQNFPQYVDDVMALMEPSGVKVPLRTQDYILRATPKAGSRPAVWLLGSSLYSAHLAAAKGLPYVFAHHFSGQGTAEALATYRSEFRPSENADKPYTFLTVNAAVADTDEEARDLALPNMQMMARLRTGEPFGAIDLVEDALANTLTPQQDAMVESGLRRSVVGGPASAAEQIRELAAGFGVDEVMVHAMASAHRGEPADQAQAREHTLTLLAQQFLGA
ncbi:LLM class flavin-dependent oxidoreductase [soil metagenome]